jgi:hypothetical protein
VVVMVSAITQVLVPGRIATPGLRGDGGRQDTIEVTVESMVEVRLLQMFPRGCRAQSAEHCGQGIYVGIQRLHRTVQWLPLQRGGEW